MAAPIFHPLRIREVRSETADAVTIAFDVPAALRDVFRFTQGQFVTLRAEIDGQEVRRAYSICVGVADYEARGELRVGIKRVPGGCFSRYANERLHAGAMLDVMPPDGRFFTSLDPAQAKHYVGFAGGSGITPILALVKTTLAVEPTSRFTLIYGNRSVASIMFAEELEDLKNRYLDRLALYHVLSDEPQEVELLNGLLDADKCRALLQTVVPAECIDEVFICGPTPMMDAVEATLRAAGVAPRKLHVERFGVPSPQAGAPNAANATATSAAAADAGSPAAALEVVLDGKRRALRLPYEGVSVLDAGLRAGLALPYACKSGVCCTCRAKVLAGQLRMDRTGTLEDHEIAAGFVLTCQAHPLTEQVVVSYDER